MADKSSKSNNHVKSGFGLQLRNPISSMVAESVHLKNFFSKKINLPKSFILTKNAAETDHEKISTAEIGHFLKILHVAETVHFWWTKLFI